MTTPFEFRDRRGEDNTSSDDFGLESSGREAPVPASETEKSRAHNIQWTVAQDYFWKPDSPVYDHDGKVNLYDNSIRGAIHRYYEAVMLADYTDFLKAEFPQAQDFIRMMDIVLEEGAYQRAVTHRPALGALRKQEAKSKLRRYDSFLPKDMVGMLGMAHVQRIMGIVPKVTPMTLNLLNDLEGLSNLDTADLIEGLNSVFKKHFHINPSLKGETELTEKIEKRKKKPETTKTDGDFKPDDLVDQLNIGAAEFTSNVQAEDLTGAVFEEIDPNKKHKTTEEKVRQAIEDTYGESALSLKEEADLLKKVAYGNHEEAKLYISTGHYPDPETYQAKRAQELYDKNYAYKEEHRPQIHREITRLSDKLKSVIMNEVEEGPTTSHSGDLIGGAVWRAIHMDNNRIFQNSAKDNPGSLIVDLLIDASASQQDRRAQVAMQAYILASALRRVNIPFRASSFQSQQGYTILRDYVDYEGKKTPDEVLHYFPYAGNRDGFALRIVHERMKRTDHAKNVLIMLSDGKPHDKRSSQGKQGGRSAQYTDLFAVRDTAEEIRQLRQDNIAVLGVFTGLEEDMNAAKTIYGSQFAYVKQIERFSEIVANFLKEEILRLG